MCCRVRERATGGAVPGLTSTLYPRGDYEFQASWDDALTGLPVRESRATLDYLWRVRDKHDLDERDHGREMLERAPRAEYPDVDP